MQLKPIINKISLALLVGGLLTLTVRQVFFPRLICLPNRSGDSEEFGRALAVDGDYLAIGDPGANRVVLFRRGFRGRWRRIQNILPPEGSTTARAGLGFGYSLDFKDGVLAIGSYRRDITGMSSQPPPDWYLGGIYFTSVRNGGAGTVQEVSLPDTSWVTGDSIALLDENIVFTARNLPSEMEFLTQLLIADLDTGQARRLMGYPGKNIYTTDMESGLDSNGHILLLGESRIESLGGGYLISPDEDIEEIAIIETSPYTGLSRAGTFVALFSEDLVALGRTGIYNSQQTLIFRRQEDGEWKLLDYIPSGGYLDTHLSQLLISVSPPGTNSYAGRIEHTLVRISDKNVIIQSEIRWISRWLGLFKLDAHPPETRGIIDRGRLVLSANGRVVSISSNNLPSFYWISIHSWLFR